MTVAFGAFSFALNLHEPFVNNNNPSESTNLAQALNTQLNLQPSIIAQGGVTVTETAVGSYDFVVASGIFGLDAEGARERIRPTIARLYEWARVGAAANFLSRRSPTPAEARVYVDPAEALELGLALTPSVRIDHTYLPNDFTLHLYKTPAWEGEKARAR